MEEATQGLHHVQVAMPKAERHIVAMGGGGFSMEPENPLLDRYLLALTGKERPKACFLPTASGDAEGYIARFHAVFKAFPCQPSHLSLFNGKTPDLEGILLSQDLIYVGGGNTRNMLVLWREWGVDRILKRAWDQGIVLAGLSAGMICWFQQGVTDSVPGTLGPLGCLGFLPGSACPHYDGEPGRRPAYQLLVAKGRLKPGYAADDGVALRFSGERLVEIVSSRPRARAWRLSRGRVAAVERELVPVYLGGRRGKSA